MQPNEIEDREFIRQIYEQTGIELTENKILQIKNLGNLKDQKDI